VSADDGGSQWPALSDLKGICDTGPRTRASYAVCLRVGDLIALDLARPNNEIGTR
jgi:hypothetical protein